MRKQVVLTEEKVELIVYALRHSVPPSDKEDIYWELIAELEGELNRRSETD